jgi:rubrerythrin
MQAALFDAGVELTVRNLFAAYQGELSTQANYLAFAKQADSDGYHGIASLFRAAARAEQIHANNQARVLRQMGAEASANIEVSAVRSTLENLRSALTGESYEIDTLYPSFIDQATAKINSTAVRSFVWALEAEKTHAQLYTEAIALVEAEALGSWIANQRNFYVCPVCACTSHDKTENCTICSYPSERVETIH